MRPRPIDIGTNSEPAESGHAGACRHINCFLESLGQNAKSARGLFAVDGYSDFATLSGSGGVRAFLDLSASELLVVCGRILYRIDQGGSFTVIGGIPSIGMVTMARNREVPDPSVAIVSDGLVYYYKAGVLTQNIDPDLPPVISVTGVDGYFSFLCLDGRHFASEQDSSDVTALSFATAESNPDLGVRNWLRGRDLCLGGTESIEFWSNVGGDPYPFSRTTSIDVGVLSGRSIADIDQTSAFVAHDGTVRRLQGYQAEIISTHAVERAIADEPNHAGISASSWQSRGHTHYALSGTDWTWVYDSRTGTWHERQSYHLKRWRGGQVIKFGRKVIVGDYASPKLYELKHHEETEAGQPLIMAVQTPPVHGFPVALTHHALHVDVVPGVGQSNVPDPHLMLDYSDDGGDTWSSQRVISLGREAQALQRVVARRLGRSRSRTYRVSASAGVRRGVIGMSIEAAVLGA